MAPDRGSNNTTRLQSSRVPANMRSSNESDTHERTEAQRELAQRASAPQNFTIRGVLVGLVIGVVICFSNMYFGLQTGWVSGMAMPSALLGFAWFKVVARTLSYPFTPVENVLIQSVAGSVGTMPLGCGFVGVLPALNFLLKPEENGPLDISLWKLVVWALGICFFGVVFAVPLRKEVIIREKLKFPSGTATALMIGVLHGEKHDANIIKYRPREGSQVDDEQERLLPSSDDGPEGADAETAHQDEAVKSAIAAADWKARIRTLVIAFGVSALYTLVSYFVPQLRDVPFLGLPLAQKWLWTLNPSPAYVGQGIIMGPATTLHMLLGAILGWGILSPLAKQRGWAPGPVNDWETGSKGWIVWISLAIMLTDALVSLGWLIVRPLISYGRIILPELWREVGNHSWKDIVTLNIHPGSGTYSGIRDGHSNSWSGSSLIKKIREHSDGEEEPDAPPEHLISKRTTLVGLVLSIIVCVAAVHITFPGLVPFGLTLLALVFALLMSIMGVRALGETDLNPVSGISKITQLIFAAITPPGKNAVIINLIAGAISESGALQAGDLLQDLKAGHLLGAAPNAQFWGQIIGSTVGAIVSALVYKLYVSVYKIPGGLFQVPTGYVWIFTARLVTGSGLPPMVTEWASGAAVIWFALTAARTYGNAVKARGNRAPWIDYVPGGIAVAVGMYNTPSFTMARTIGGLISMYWKHYKKREETPIIVLASGLILGEGVFSIVNLLLASAKIPHL
ncbi:oligopeptide transporter-like protein [Pseudovirgaria hyperparasitica]|uniref:Oligopeptide transporter-like protein n=1 Tax=Pseudovirgaria hyperparasitica TaxID=470096 RepID=A0A6A6W902_9PEZI|nr:oligopeptide transporter-like protein [Pseudovirgaria hyperparasitica]KAF2758410.1 oligopeptide transporter-like protein [Pseudovirgaria hyperparasitica]